MIINKHKDSDIVRLQIIGKIDMTTSKEFEAEIKKSKALIDITKQKALKDLSKKDVTNYIG